MYAEIINAGYSKGLEIPGHDPRGALGQALAHATSNRSACHTRAYMIASEIIGKPKLTDRHTFIGKPRLLSVVCDGLLTMCRFSSFALSAKEYSDILSAVTGLGHTSEDLLRAGFSRADDTLPDRFFGKNSIDRSKFEDALSEYYRFRGWNSDGVPADWKLKELGLDAIAPTRF